MVLEHSLSFLFVVVMEVVCSQCDHCQRILHCIPIFRYAMAAGHVRSLTSFLLMKTMTHIHFDAAGGVSAEANNEAVAAMAGIQVRLRT